MVTLNEIRDNFHSEKGYCSVEVNKLLIEAPDFYIDGLLKFAIKAKLEEAAERAMNCDDIFHLEQAIINTPLD